MLTVERLREVLDYDVETGVFRWKVNRSGPAKVGLAAGHLTKGGQRVIVIDGQRYYASRLAWFYVHGCWPVGDLNRVNGVRDDDRLSNLREGPTAPSDLLLTVERLRELLTYNSETGAFYRLVVTSNKVRVGDRAGWIDGKGYWKISVDGNEYAAHRLAFFWIHGRWPDEQLDHKNHERASCLVTDLREANNSQNQANRNLSSTNTSGFKGVCWDKRRNKYIASITFRGKRVHLKYCATAEQAARIYDYVAERVFKEFALTNKMLGLLTTRQATAPMISRAVK